MHGDEPLPRGSVKAAETLPFISEGRQVAPIRHGTVARGVRACSRSNARIAQATRAVVHRASRRGGSDSRRASWNEFSWRYSLQAPPRTIGAAELVAPVTGPVVQDR